MALQARSLYEIDLNPFEVLKDEEFMKCVGNHLISQGYSQSRRFEPPLPEQGVIPSSGEWKGKVVYEFGKNGSRVTLETERIRRYASHYGHHEDDYCFTSDLPRRLIYEAQSRDEIKNLIQKYLTQKKKEFKEQLKELGREQIQLLKQVESIDANLSELQILQI